LLSKALANPSNTLKELYLWGNTIGNAGAADLAKVITHLRSLERDRAADI
jgi:Ran GTPase-activating protein (RanGAP) involved in mRNA processing and transport